MTRLSTQSRIMSAVEADQDRVSDLAFALWCKAQSLSVQPAGALALPHVRQSLIEARDLMNTMIGEVGHG